MKIVSGKACMIKMKVILPRYCTHEVKPVPRINSPWLKLLIILKDIGGHPTPTDFNRGRLDDQLSEKLWEVSEEITDVRY